MNQIRTKAIVLHRTNYSEADRIVTFLTQDRGKIRVIAKGVRLLKSKLAGGIELFSITEIGYIQGRGQLGTLTSARLIRYYDSIVKDINRVQLGYEVIKQLDRAVEDQPEPEYFDLLDEAFKSLNNNKIAIDLIRIWFQAQLLRLSGHTPNLKTDESGDPLDETKSYDFNYDIVGFEQREGGTYSSSDIKFLRLLFLGNTPQALQVIVNLDKIIPHCQQLVQAMLQTYIRI
ncbi:MAG: DNA repair protein RecO [Candidatus Saccharimonadales bacterium]